MIFRRLASVCLVLLASGLIVSGCGGDDGGGFQGDKAAEQIKEQYPDKAGGVELTSIECEGDDDSVGSTFTCSGTNDADVEVSIEGEITGNDTEEDTTQFSWEVTKLVSPGSTFGDVAADTLSQTRAVDTVECPDGIVIEEGTEVDCVGTMDNGEKREVKLTLTDGSGNFDINLLGPTEG